MWHLEDKTFQRSGEIVKHEGSTELSKWWDEYNLGTVNKKGPIKNYNISLGKNKNVMETLGL